MTGSFRRIGRRPMSCWWRNRARPRHRHRIYLANRGVKAANIPLVPGIPLPDAIWTLKKPLIIGLYASPERIVQIRENRILALTPPRTSRAMSTAPRSPRRSPSRGASSAATTGPSSTLPGGRSRKRRPHHLAAHRTIAACWPTGNRHDGSRPGIGSRAARAAMLEAAGLMVRLSLPRSTSVLWMRPGPGKAAPRRRLPGCWRRRRPWPSVPPIPRRWSSARTRPWLSARGGSPRRLRSARLAAIFLP